MASSRCSTLADTIRVTARKARRIYAADLPWTPHVDDPSSRSLTVANLAVDDPAAWHARAAASGFLLGKGYGDLKSRCIRIATFPAHG